jgi:hypothetical protein
MPCDTAALLEQAKCIITCIPPGMIPAASLAALCNISGFSVGPDGFVTIAELKTTEFAWFTISDASGVTFPVVAEVYHEVNTGVGGGGISGGASFDFRMDSDTVDRQLQVRLSSAWVDPADATRTSHLRITPVLNSTQTEAVRIANAGFDLMNGTPLRIAGVSYFNPLSVYAAGTAYTLTATSAAVDFGTTDPIITITQPGTYAIRAQVRVALNAATFAANRTLTVKLRRTNNTPADVSNSTTPWLVAIMTTLSETMAVIQLPEVLYTTVNSDDAIQIFADISVLPSAGSISINQASIIAVRLS